MLTSIFGLLVAFAIVVGLYFLFDWAIKTIGPPEPIAKIAQIVMVLVIVGVVLLYLLPKTLALFGISL